MGGATCPIQQDGGSTSLQTESPGQVAGGQKVTSCMRGESMCRDFMCPFKCVQRSWEWNNVLIQQVLSEANSMPGMAWVPRDAGPPIGAVSDAQDPGVEMMWGRFPESGLSEVVSAVISSPLRLCHGFWPHPGGTAGQSEGFWVSTSTVHGMEKVTHICRCKLTF